MRNVDNKLDLSPLIVFGEKIPFGGRSKTALRTEGEVF
jgi:hypothetical protein